jgi:MFS transporter, SP family, sugar:H+ symporter
MAGGVIVPNDTPAGGYGGGLTLSVFMSCLVAASGGLIFGYDIGISGAAAPSSKLVFPCAGSD